MLGNNQSPDASLQDSVREFGQVRNQIGDLVEGRDKFYPAPRKKGAFKGYSVWANRGDQTKRIQPGREAYGLERHDLLPCVLSSRQTVQTSCRPTFWFWRLFKGLSDYFEPEVYKSYLAKVDDYIAMRSDPKRSISELHASRLELKASCESVLRELNRPIRNLPFISSDNRHRKEVFQTQLGILQREAWSIGKLFYAGQGEFLMPEDELECVPDFAHGESSSLDKVRYKARTEEGEEFEALFRPCSKTEKVTSKAAARYGLMNAVRADWSLGENKDIRDITAEDAKLANRAVMFCELDSLLGVNLTPATWYAFHNGKHGSCQEFVKGADSLIEEGWVPANQLARANIGELLLGVYRSQIPEYRLEFKPGCELTDAEKSSCPLDLHNTLIAKIERREVIPMMKGITRLAAPKADCPDFQKKMADAQLLDFVAGMVDRSAGNILYTEDGPQLIDNDLCFLSRLTSTAPTAEMSIRAPDADFVSFSIPRQIDRRTAERIANQIDVIELLYLSNLHQMSLPDSFALLQRFQVLQFVCRRLLANQPLPPCKLTEGEAYEYFLTTVSPFWKGDVELLGEWSLGSYMKSLEDHNSYTRRHMVEYRKNVLTTMLVGQPEQLAEMIPDMIRSMGPKALAEVFSGETPDKVEYVLKLYSQKVAAKEPRDCHQAVIFADHFIRHRLERKGIVGTLSEEESHKLEKQKADMIKTMLGEERTAMNLGAAIFYAEANNCLSPKVLDVLMTDLLKKAQGKVKEQPNVFFYQDMYPEGWCRHAPAELVQAMLSCYEAASATLQPMPARLVHKLKLWEVFHYRSKQNATEVKVSEQQRRAEQKLSNLLELNAAYDTRKQNRKIDEYLAIRRELQEVPERDRENVILRHFFPDYSSNVENKKNTEVEEVVRFLVHFFVNDPAGFEDR